MQCLKGFLILLLVLVLAACANPVREQPAPLESRDQLQSAPLESNDRQQPGGAQVHAYRAPQQLALARPQPARAVQVLMRRAEDQRRSGDYAAAAVSIERGLRIEPRNAQLWNRLAHVRAAQGQHGRVEQFAAKSNALAGNDDLLRADNWGLIADALAARGDSRAAAQARQRARVLR